MKVSRRSSLVPLLIATCCLIAFTPVAKADTAPTLTWMNPPAGVLGASVTVYLTGTNFVSGATVAVGGPGITVTNVTVVSGTRITATFAVAATATLGAAAVTVTTSGGTSGAKAFTITPAPPPLTVSVSGGPLDFGNVATGTFSGFQTLTLHNSTGAGMTGITLAFSSPVFRRMPAADSGTCGATLAPGN